jgi:hypothetical protein
MNPDQDPFPNQDHNLDTSTDSLPNNHLTLVEVFWPNPYPKKSSETDFDKDTILK